MCGPGTPVIACTRVRLVLPLVVLLPQDVVGELNLPKMCTIKQLVCIGLQEMKQLERQQHKQEQSRVSAELTTSSLQPLTALNSSSNGSTTDHLDDFVARIEKLRQVGQGLVARVQNTGLSKACLSCCPTPCSQGLRVQSCSNPIAAPVFAVMLLAVDQVEARVQTTTCSVFKPS